MRLMEEAKDDGSDLSGLDDTLAETMKGLTLDKEDPPADAGGGSEAVGGGEIREPVGRAVPKAWKPEMHPHWSKLDPAVQEYLEQRENEVSTGFEKHRQAAEFGRQFQETINPFLPDIQQWGVQPTQAVQTLLNAHRALKSADKTQRRQMFEKLARDYGVEFTPQEEAYIDPALQTILSRTEKLENDLRTERQAKYDAIRAETDKETQRFFADTVKHPYANEVADHIVLLLQNPQLTLEDAYDQAVYANPSTRAKELARLSKEAAAKLLADKEAEAEAARKARGTRVRGSNNEKPTAEPLGDMDSTIRSTLKEIRSRV